MEQDEGNGKTTGEASSQDQNISSHNHDVLEVTEENAKDGPDLEQGKDDHQLPIEDKTEADVQKDMKDVDQSKVMPEEEILQKQVLKDNGKEESSKVEDVSHSPSAQPSKPGANVNDSWGIFQEDWLDVLGNGELRKKILVPGKGHTTRPEQDQLVTLRTKGWLEDGTEIDFHDSITICLGDGDVVQGMVCALGGLQW